MSRYQHEVPSSCNATVYLATLFLRCVLILMQLNPYHYANDVLQKRGVLFPVWCWLFSYSQGHSVPRIVHSKTFIAFFYPWSFFLMIEYLQFLHPKEINVLVCYWYEKWENFLVNYYSICLCLLDVPKSYFQIKQTI